MPCHVRAIIARCGNSSWVADADDLIRLKLWSPYAVGARRCFIGSSRRQYCLITPARRAAFSLHLDSELLTGMTGRKGLRVNTGCARYTVSANICPSGCTRDSWRRGPVMASPSPSCCRHCRPGGGALWQAAAVVRSILLHERWLMLRQTHYCRCASKDVLKLLSWWCQPIHINTNIRSAATNSPRFCIVSHFLSKLEQSNMI